MTKTHLHLCFQKKMQIKLRDFSEIGHSQEDPMFVINIADTIKPNTSQTKTTQLQIQKTQHTQKHHRCKHTSQTYSFNHQLTEGTGTDALAPVIVFMYIIVIILLAKLSDA